jgi:hypothetical protein
MTNVNMHVTDVTDDSMHVTDVNMHVTDVSIQKMDWSPRILQPWFQTFESTD